MLRVSRSLPCLVLVLTLFGCHGTDLPQSSSRNTSPDPCAVALVPHEAGERLDLEISRLQHEVRKGGNPTHGLERLGWLFVEKARVSNDPGYYKLAEESALCLESKRSGSLEASLLRGHVLHHMHRFGEAETLARELVGSRGAPFDYGLLGDVVMEQGRLGEAADAYQKMIDLKPNLQSYSRAAHLRWLKGDLRGAIELMEMAAGAGSPRDAESAAWAYSRLALYELQAGNQGKALQACESALEYQKDYAAALLARGRVFLAEGKSGAALRSLEQAARLNPLPEYLWTFAEALDAGGRSQEARLVETELIQKGRASDPRTLALFLSTRGTDVETALTLAQQELKTRSDIFTLDALAWSLAAAGKTQEAYAAMKRALMEGTQDARLFYHASVIAAKAGQQKEARHWLSNASAIRQMLLPSESEQLSHVRTTTQKGGA